MLTFHYKRTRKQTAANVFGGMFVLPLWLVVFRYLGEGKSGFTEFLEIFVYVVIGVEVAMAVYIVWLLRNPASFEIRLSEKTFSIDHPIFEEWCFSVRPSEIRSIENSMDTGGHKQIRMTTTDGKSYQLCPNYSYSRKKLYAVLTEINPDIAVPKAPSRFTKNPG